MSKKVFFVGVKAIITDGDSILLLKKRSGDREFWDAPGGCINEGEEIEQALVRELSEELPSLKMNGIGSLLSAYALTRDIKDDISLTLLFYRVNAHFSDKIELSDEHSEYRWMSYDEAVRVGSEGIPEAVAGLRG